MTQWRAEFHGRINGALGITYDINTTVDGNTEEEAKLNLYKKYEHIKWCKLTEIETQDKVITQEVVLADTCHCSKCIHIFDKGEKVKEKIYIESGNTPHFHKGRISLGVFCDGCL